MTVEAILLEENSADLQGNMKFLLAHIFYESEMSIKTVSTAASVQIHHMSERTRNKSVHHRPLKILVDLV